MGRAKIALRLTRLDELIGILKGGDYYTAADLAKRLQVSSRTVMRDLNVLKMKGYPIESDQGRGGGIRLHRQWGVGRLFLNYHEVIDLLLSLAIMEKIGSPIFLSNLKAIRHKIAVSFPEEQRQNIQNIRQRILIGDLASEQVSGTYQEISHRPENPLYEAFFDMKNLHINYTDGTGSITQRVIEPHYLFLNWPAWYVLAWDHLRGDVRCFRLDRIGAAKIEDKNFKLDHSKNFLASIEEYTAPL